MFAPKNILVPTNFSDYCDEALKGALELAKQYNAKVYLLHVMEPMSPCAPDYCLDMSAVKETETGEILHAKEMMQRELSKYAEYRDVEVISDVREGEPVEEILKEQVEKGVDLIVMPSQGKTGILRRMMGQISEKVMEEAKSSVLLVKH